MSNFTEDLDVRHLGIKHEFHGMWELLRDLRYYIGEEGSCEKVTLMKGFITDGGSYSNWLVPLVGSQTGDYFESYALHDGLARRPDLMCYSRSNKILKEALAVQRMPKRKIRRVGWGVAWGGPTKNPKLLLNAIKYVRIETVEVIRTYKEIVAK